MTRLITYTTGLLTLALAAISFTLSFNALTDLAAQHGVSIPPLFPFMVEAAVIVFSVAMLYWSLQAERTRWLWTLILLKVIECELNEFDRPGSEPDSDSEVNDE